MSRMAKVTSIDAVEAMSMAIRSFIEEVTSALDHLDLQVKRAQQWIGYDRKEYWQHEVRHGWDRVAQARAELERCLTFRKAGDHQSACIDEKKALERAQRRLRTAEEKVRAVKRWIHVVDRQVLEFTGSVSQVDDWVKTELPKALAALERMSRALEDYVAIATAPAGEGMERPSAARAASVGSEEGEPDAGDREAAEDHEQAAGSAAPSPAEPAEPPSTHRSEDDESMGSHLTGDPTEAGVERPPGGQG